MSAGASERFSSFALTHVGKVRERNEDAFTCRDNAGLWAVADGMGGHEAGDVASKTVIQALDPLDVGNTPDERLSRTVAALHAANRELTELGARLATERPPASTIAVLLVAANKGAVVWAGDSRVYRVRGEKITQLTHDHSHVQDLVVRGEIDPEDAESHPLAHLITRAVGIRETLRPESREFEVLPGDRFLLCTDGLSRLLSAEEIGGFSLGENPQEWVKAMLDVTLELGAPDNVTMVVVDVICG